MPLSNICLTFRIHFQIIAAAINPENTVSLGQEPASRTKYLLTSYWSCVLYWSIVWFYHGIFNTNGNLIVMIWQKLKSILVTTALLKSISLNVQEEIHLLWSNFVSLKGIVNINFLRIHYVSFQGTPGKYNLFRKLIDLHETSSMKTGA